MRLDARSTCGRLFSAILLLVAALGLPAAEPSYVPIAAARTQAQGTTVTEALHTLGYSAVSDVRQGKYFELEIDAGSADEARRIAAEAADKLLANPVIESYRIEVDTSSAEASAAGVR